jgi:hypothetical protein
MAAQRACAGDGAMNGNGKSVWWLMGLFAAGVVGLTSKTIANSEEISALQVENSYIGESVRRIESKVDRILLHYER